MLKCGCRELELGRTKKLKEPPFLQGRDFFREGPGGGWRK